MRLTSLGLLSTIATGKSLFTFTNGKFFHQSATRYMNESEMFFSTNQRSVVIDQSEYVFHFPESLSSFLRDG